MSSQLIWQLVNNHNSFKRKNRTGNRKVLSAEPGNLFNKHSYKYSGLANSKTIDIQPGEDGTVVITTNRPKNSNKPGLAKNKQTSKRSPGKAASSIGKAASRIRPDLKKAAQARMSAVARSQQKQKAAAS